MSGRGRYPGQKIGPYLPPAGATRERQLRAESGLTQSEVATAAGISPRAVRNFERWGDTGSREYERYLAVIGARVSGRLFDDDQLRERAIQLARATKAESQ